MLTLKYTKKPHFIFSLHPIKTHPFITFNFSSIFRKAEKRRSSGIQNVCQINGKRVDGEWLVSEGNPVVVEETSTTWETFAFADCSGMAHGGVCYGSNKECSVEKKWCPDKSVVPDKLRTKCGPFKIYAACLKSLD